MSCLELTKLILEIVTSIATVAVVIVAIWGDQIRGYLTPPKLHIVPAEPHGIRGHVLSIPQSPKVIVPRSQNRMTWYVLKVINQRNWLTVKNCQVMLRAISRRGPDGIYHPEPFTVSRQYCWAPSESTPTSVSIRKEQAFDFGYIADTKDACFVPVLYTTPINFSGYVRKSESVRYSLEICADNFSSPRYQVFEVSWDGEWQEDSELMSKHLTIREVE